MFSQALTSTPRSIPSTQLSSHCPKPGALPGVVVAKVQDLALGRAELRPVGLSPAIHPVQIKAEIERKRRWDKTEKAMTKSELADRKNKMQLMHSLCIHFTS